MAKNTTYRVPGIENVRNLPRSTTVAVFVKGLDAYAEARGTVSLAGEDGEARDARLIGSEAGRLFNLASRFMGQAPVATGQKSAPVYNPSPATIGSSSDVAFFEALEAAYGADALHPLTPYSVLAVYLDPEVLPATPTT